MCTARTASRARGNLSQVAGSVAHPHTTLGGGNLTTRGTISPPTLRLSRRSLIGPTATRPERYARAPSEPPAPASRAATCQVLAAAHASAVAEHAASKHAATEHPCRALPQADIQPSAPTARHASRHAARPTTQLGPPRSSARHQSPARRSARPATNAQHAVQLGLPPKARPTTKTQHAVQLGPPFSAAGQQLGPPSNFGSPSAREPAATYLPRTRRRHELRAPCECLWLLPQTRKSDLQVKSGGGPGQRKWDGRCLQHSPKAVCTHSASVAVVVGHSHSGAAGTAQAHVSKGYSGGWQERQCYLPLRA